MINFPEPRNAKQMMRFLGLTGVYGSFIKDFATIAEPLHKLTHKDMPWECGHAQAKAFTLLKEAMTSAPVLIHPDFSKEFTIFSDASIIGAGAVLCQMINGVHHPVSYA